MSSDTEKIAFAFRAAISLVAAPLNAITFPLKHLAKRTLRSRAEEIFEYEFHTAKIINGLSLVLMVILFLPAVYLSFFPIEYFLGSGKATKEFFTDYKNIPWIIFLVASLVGYAVAKGVRELLNTPDLEKKEKGAQAEATVRNYLTSSFSPEKGWCVFNDCLFVFNRDQENEWSAEVDHIVVGGRAIFLVETKYKSGTIKATADATQWEVTRFDRSSTMRNALKQSQNSTRALSQQLGIHGANFIPVVAFVGEDVQVINAPSNVVHYPDLANVIISIDNTIEYKGMNHEQAVQIIAQSCAKDRDAMKRHILRAKKRAADNARKQIFENAAI